MTESPFVRSGAVVRCTSCQNKYRIKSAYVERVLTTGPRTLDEADAVLRTDSVDIDPDEASPVSIDDDGNVVGLSGLSELMRRSDARGAEAKVQSRMQAPPPPPAAKQRSQPQASSSPAVTRLSDEPVSGENRAQRRARLESQRRRKRTQALIIAALACLVVVSGVVVYIMAIRGGKDGDLTGSGNQTSAGNGANQSGTSDRTNVSTNNANPNPKPPDSQQNPDLVRTPELFPDIGPPSKNPNPKYVEKTGVLNTDAPPTDVPTVVIPARRIEHEGWYITTPPRGAATATAEKEIEVAEFKSRALEDGTTLLSTTVTNRSQYALYGGELHLMLLDSSGGVFAETYMPLIMIASGTEQQVSLPIATRYWQRERGVRTAVTVSAWGAKLSPIEEVKTDAVILGPYTALRVSAHHAGEAPLRSVLIVIEAKDQEGKAVARFVVENEQLYVEPGKWLDLMVATPVPNGATVASWSAIVQPR